MKVKLKGNTKIRELKGIKYLVNNDNKTIKNKPWLGDIFSCFYDRIMEKSIFPKKFNASYKKHHNILRKLYASFKNSTILEFAVGSGDSIRYLSNNNSYYGIDISSGLLKKRKKKLHDQRFETYDLYNSDACNTPFENSSFEIAICNLSLNFFPDIDRFIEELKRVLQKGGTFYCSLPLPELKDEKAQIRGNLYSMEELKGKFIKKGFSFDRLNYENGALLYFFAELKNMDQTQV